MSNWSSCLLWPKKSRLIANLLIYLTSLREPTGSNKDRSDHEPTGSNKDRSDFHEFSKRFPEIAGYITTIVSQEKRGLTTDLIDIFSALVQFVWALSEHEQDTAFFYAHLLGLVTITNDHRHEIIGHLVGKLSDLNASKSSIIIWGILTNKIFLRELGLKASKVMIKLIKRLYLINAYGLGNSNYNLLFAIALLIYPNLPTVDAETFSLANNVTPAELELFMNNAEGTIYDRRKFPVPTFAIDLSTKRGRGSLGKGNKKSTTYYLYYCQNNPPKDCVVPNLEDWSLKEICKSHGSYKNYVQCSHVLFAQLEGNKLANESETIYDPYYKVALKILLDVERRKNYTYTKYTKLVRFITEDLIRTQHLWIVLPNWYLVCNPLQFDNTEIQDTHLDLSIFRDPNLDNSGHFTQMNYPEGFCPVRVYLTHHHNEEFFMYSNRLKGMLSGLVPIEFHTVTIGEKILIIKQPLKLKKFTDIYSHLADYSLIKSYVLLKLFQLIIRASTDDKTVFQIDNSQIVSFVDRPSADRPSADRPLADLSPLVVDLISEYKYEFLYMIKEWYHSLKSSEELATQCRQVYNYICQLPVHEPD